MADKIDDVERLLEVHPHIEIIPNDNLDDGTVIPANNNGELFLTIPSMVTKFYVSRDVFDALKKVKKNK